MSTLKNAELLLQFEEVEQIEDDYSTIIKKMIVAFITKAKIKQTALYVYCLALTGPYHFYAGHELKARAMRGGSTASNYRGIL